MLGDDIAEPVYRPVGLWTEDLNDEQLEAVTTTEGYVRVVAGPGSGKTKTLTSRYVYLVNELGVSTANILCVTFTNKAANEMKKRVRTMAGDVDTSYISTFHGFCVRFLREDIRIISWPQNFVILDTDDTESILKIVYETSNILARTYTFDNARKMISTRKFNGQATQYLTNPDIESLKERYVSANHVEDKIFFGYLYEQKKCYGLDFNDLMILTLHILQTYEDIRIKWQKRLMYVMVDEFQDVSATQYELANILSEYHRNLFVVGDPDQTIYTWRGANVNFILNFPLRYENARTVVLDKNYRSIPDILQASNSLIKHNKSRVDKDLVAIRDNIAFDNSETNNEQKQISTLYFHGKTARIEAEWIAKEIQTLIEKGCQYSDIAILYRSHYVSRSVEEVFINKKIPYVLYSGVEFYKRKEIKDTLSYLRMVIYSDDLSFLRVINEPARNIGKKRISFLKTYAESHNCSLYNALLDNMEGEIIQTTRAAEFVSVIEKYKARYKDDSVSDIVVGILNDSGYEEALERAGDRDRLENIAELKQSIAEYEKSTGEENVLESYLQDIALYTNIDKETQKNSVKMMTIHTAKGLEFPYVFVCSLNEGVFPNSHVKTRDNLEEERRLAYVAFTRAENRLYLSESEGINYDRSFKYPSRFIFNIGKENLRYVEELPDNLQDSAVKFIEDAELNLDQPSRVILKVGDRVKHPTFGEGTITDIPEDNPCYVIKFDRLDTERNLGLLAPIRHIGHVESDQNSTTSSS